MNNSLIMISEKKCFFFYDLWYLKRGKNSNSNHFSLPSQQVMISFLLFFFFLMGPFKMSTDLDWPPLHPTSPIFFSFFPLSKRDEISWKTHTHTCLEQRWRSGDIHIVAYRVCFWHWKRMKEGDIKKKEKKLSRPLKLCA